MCELVLVECDYCGYYVVLVLFLSLGGVIICEMLNILEGYLFKELGWYFVQVMYYQIEVMCYVYVDCNSYLGDLDFVKNLLDCLLSKDYVVKICVVIDLKKVGVLKDIKLGVELYEGSNMMYYLIVDKYGNVVLVMYIFNDWFGVKVMVVKMGVVLNDEMDDFIVKVGVLNLYGLVQGEVNLIVLGKCLLLLMSLIIVIKDGKFVMVVGMFGGSCIIIVVMLIMINVIDYGMNVQEVVDMLCFYQ